MTMSNTVRPIGTNKQLFLDESLCAASEGITLRMHRPEQPSEPVLTLDQPYETVLPDASIKGYSSAMHDGGKIRIWYFYSGGRSDFYRRRVCYAESNDGVNFVKPKLRLHEMGGTMDNNAVIADPIQGACVWIDPTAPPNQRYRTQAKWGPFPGSSAKVHFYASPDGLRWQRTHVVDIGACDTQNVVFWDEKTARYLMYTRQWERFEDGNLNHRKVRRLESQDLKVWTGERLVWEADAMDNALHTTSTGKPPVDYYGACVFPYPDSDLELFFAQPFWHWKDRPEEEKWGYNPDPENLKKKIIHLAPATLDVRLGYGRDGCFERAVERSAFLPTGRDGGFDSRRTWLMPQPIVMDEEIWFYYAGGNRDHDHFVDPSAEQELSGIGRAVLRLDGFVSADAAYDGGWLCTPPLTFTGSRLELNAEAVGGSAIRVEILNASGQPIPGFSKAEADPICANGVRLPVRWNGSEQLSHLAGQPIQLKFYMQDASLYAFRFQ